MSELTVGLLPAPELPEKIARSLANELPDLLYNEIDNTVEWNIEVVIDPLTGAAENANEIIDETEERKKRNGWDYAICLTDLPIYEKSNIVLADVNKDRCVSQISLPAFGSVPMKKRIREVVISMVRELHHHQYEVDKSEKKKRFPKTFSPIRTVIPDNDENNTRYIVIPKLNGRLRVLFGMVYANRPWTIFPSFKSVVAVAFATGTYGLIFPTLWTLSAAFEQTRFIALMFTALFSMIVWIIFAHNLWEKPSHRSKYNLRRLYNFATVVTLSIAVILYYLMLFILFFVAVRIFVPAELFGMEAGLESSAQMMDYLHLAWLATSVATLAGALGAGLENDELVRNITYGYRQKRRYQEIEQESTKDHDTKGNESS
ncbi:hypothetical protein N781_09495 [Pontibacillus halophilus JSM 076056 = DSM 19796]|uniref:5,10-methylene-tetrahydrofolate dehydrogenase n=1 Tax=Pontibacillus halophilus JSM 076056 = DSM 19796 TaxID=1385510 RepID=A0A0A5HYP9_9BACI|nr:hypothetical protein [Pontibacillus halophilus]KGX88742.1 hypothetical protein N781_09495 [Pontibacillus halophilus JSM 076056 = DSM 19796]